MLDHPELVFALLIFLASRGQALPPSVLASLEVGADELPEMSRRWWQVLVEAFLFHPSFALHGEHRAFRDSLAKSVRG